MTNGGSNDYLLILKSVSEIPFGVGRNLLIDFLQGSADNDSIINNKLDALPSYGSVARSRGEINGMIGTLLMKGLLEFTLVKSSFRVLRLTEKGAEELKKPCLVEESIDSSMSCRAAFSEEDRSLFKEFDFFLSSYNDEQKKSITNPNQNILCIAGAGSGKTTVLTKRIEFLARFRSVQPARILAITFTRKARQEMIKRLSKAGLGNSVEIETFNSFCEKILKRYNDIIYGKPVKVLNYPDKIRILKGSLAKLGLTPEQALSKYFNHNQRRGKSDDQLMSIFMNDCFFIRDYFKFKGKSLASFSFDNSSEQKHQESAKMVQAVCRHIEESLEKHGLRDYADQLLDTIKLFNDHKEIIPEFDHVLVDEFQDVNSTQMELMKLLAPKNLFCVGDPRQAIFGWRGADISYILNFEKDHPGCEIINLTKNYRSTGQIVEIINTCIAPMKLPDLEASIVGDREVKLLNFISEEAEQEFVIQRIVAADIIRNEIFVLARTNKQLNELSEIMRLRGIKHVVKSEDIHTEIITTDEDITLATVHAIKGLEANMVFVIGCTSQNFPCKGSEHPVIEMVKLDEYDKEEEERRLLYVAMSRAKQSLYLSYSGKGITPFLTRELIALIDPSHEALKQSRISDYAIEHSFKSVKRKADSRELIARLQEWRRTTSEALGVPPFMIMHDKTLYDLAEKMPLHEDDLREVYGLGPAKIRRYGDELLELVMG